MESTNQRGELNGLLEALKYAVGYISDKDDKDVIIITDSQYLCDTIMKDWLGKWSRQNWCGSTGPIKNQDMWETALGLITEIHNQGGDVYLNWTKGHLVAYSDRNIEEALNADSAGYILLDRISTVVNRPSEYGRIAKAFNAKREEHGHPTLPADIATQWVIYNTIADCVASYTVKKMDEIQQITAVTDYVERLYNN